MSDVISKPFRHRAVAAQVMRRMIAKHGNNLTIRPQVCADDKTKFEYVIVRKPAQ